MNRVKGKVAIVTGSAMGIGRTACSLLAREGATVAVTDVLDDKGHRNASEIKNAGGSAEFWHLDVSQEAEVERVFTQIQKKFGHIDVLVNNAGTSGANKSAHEITESEWDTVMAINVKGVFFCTKHAIPYMKAAGGGSIINLSSVYGIVGGGGPPYVASKGAVRSMTKDYALIYAPDKIRVNSIHPGFIWTPMVENVVAGLPGGIEAALKQMDAAQPLGHIGEAEDIAWAVVHLASEESKFVTGSELVVDGGYIAR